MLVDEAKVLSMGEIEALDLDYTISKKDTLPAMLLKLYSYIKADKVKGL